LRALHHYWSGATGVNSRRPVNSDVMLLRISYLLLVIAVVLSTVVAQSPKVLNNGNTFPGVSLSLLSQRCLPKKKVPYVGDDFIDFSDMTTWFRLSNGSSKGVYYLADAVTSTADPVGFQLFRPSKRGDWDSPYTPARGRPDVFTGEGVKWLLLRPGSVVEFETLDFSRRRGQHAMSVFLNTKPTHDNRVELVSNAFVPKHCRKRGK
jgi:hypothetical protein